METETTEQVEEQSPGETGTRVVDRGIEERARRMGWTDQDEFRGHPDRWVDAETYVQRTDEHLPILKGTLSTMEKKMIEQERLIKDQSRRLEEMQADVKEFVGYTRLAEERAYQKALAQMKAEQRQAVEDQDLSKFDQISADIDEHIKGYAVTGSAAAKAEKVGVKPEEAAESWAKPGVFEAWVAENGWYREKAKMATYAQQLDRWLYDTKPFLTQSERLVEITSLVKEEFPEYWSNTKRTNSPTVEGSGDAAVSRVGGKKSYADLPPEAKAACDKFCGKDGTGKSGSIPGYTRADYIKDYDWGV